MAGLSEGEGWYFHFTRRLVTHSQEKRNLGYFYDAEVKADLWGKDLFTYLDDIYQHRCRYCMVFVSEHYKVKHWTNHERQSAQSRVFAGMGDYLLPVVLDDTKIPGIRLTTGYLDGRNVAPAAIADTLREKLTGQPKNGKSARTTILPTRMSAKAGRASQESAAGKGARNNDSAQNTTSNTRTSPSYPSKVSTSGSWMMLGDAFYATLLVEEKAGDLVTVQISPRTARDEAELRSLLTGSPWQRKRLPYAHGNDASLCQVQDIQVRSQNGKPVFTLTLLLERPSANSMEVNFNGVTADQVAEKRARLILLAEKPGTGQVYTDSHITHAGHGEGPLVAGCPAIVWQSLGERSAAGLHKTRLACLWELKKHGIVEHVHTLTLGPVTSKGIAVRFEGQRHARYSNTPALAVAVSGVCPLAVTKA